MFYLAISNAFFLRGSFHGCMNLTNVQGISAGVQPQPDPNQWNGAYYGYPYGHESYGYAPPPQDPNMYGYPYGNYQQQAPQQQAGYS
jgi:hypothetical protein